MSAIRVAIVVGAANCSSRFSRGHMTNTLPGGCWKETSVPIAASQIHWGEEMEVWFVRKTLLSDRVVARRLVKARTVLGNSVSTLCRARSGGGDPLGSATTCTIHACFVVGDCRTDSAETSGSSSRVDAAVAGRLQEHAEETKAE